MLRHCILVKKPANLVKDCREKPDGLIDEQSPNTDGTLKKKTDNCSRNY